ncbi:Drug resistance protein [Lasiodiplodia theobromae]|uniref:Drug resistance protein n=1 Tax=Lasiodiplodia theobromae TaxID=45133 RepID=A0A5N5D9X5_9PEZI|nr:Drug resistance protein [Lasiodiplodia theobromae]
MAAEATTAAHETTSGTPDIEALSPLERSTTTRSTFKKPTSLPREILFVSLLCTSQLLTQAGLSQSIAALHIISRTFGNPSAGQQSWFTAAYSLTVGIFILIAGRIGDVFAAHKRVFVCGYAWFGAWSLVCGFAALARSQVMFDVCRALQGIGPAFVLPNAIAILSRAYEPGRRQEMVFGLFGATAPGGFVIGAVFSSLLAERAWWPWGFWCMAVVCAALAVAGTVVIPKEEVEESAEPEGTMEKFGIFERLDMAGTVIGLTGLILFNFAWNQGPVVGWQTPYTYIILILGVLVLAVFAFIESRARFPLVPVRKLSRNVWFVLGCISAGWASFGIWVFYSWQFMELLRGSSPLLASAQFVPVALSGLCAAITTGAVLSRIPPSVVMMIAMLAFTIGSILIATAPVGQTYWAQTFVGFIIIPWGMDMSFPAGTIIMSRKLPREEQGLAASLLNTIINYSISIGLGFAGTVERQVNDGGQNLLAGYRGAFYLGIGLSSLGLTVSVCFAFVQFFESRKQRR